MIYGPLYDPKPRCQSSGCGSKRCKVAGECYYCGEPGCDECLELQTEVMPDPQTGDKGDRLVCERCNEQIKESAA